MLYIVPILKVLVLERNKFKSMTTITEDYVSFETAKLLKKKGLDADISSPHAVYSLNDGTFINLLQFIGNTSFINYNLEKCIVAPTLQMTMKWLREMHGLFISIGNDDLDYNWQIFDIENRTEDLDPTCLTDSYAGHEKYEQACEAAIKYCLENLI